MAVQKSIYEVLTIESNDQSQTVDLINGAISFDYYEDIFSPTITAKLKIMNVGNTVGDSNKRQSLYNGLPLRGGERIAVKINPNSTTVNTFLDFTTAEKYLYVSSITDVVAENNRESFTLNLTSREAITNETSRVTKKFTSKISNSVERILRDNLLTEQIKEVEETSNKYDFIGNLKKPFTVLVWLASKSLPVSNSSSRRGQDGNGGFVFYQTKEGFNFRSLLSLSKQESKATYTYSQSYPAFEGTAKVDNDYKILSHYIDRNQNLIEKLRMGAYSSDRMFFNPLTFTITSPQDGKYSFQDYKNVDTLGGSLKLPKISSSSDKTLGDVPTRIFSQILDVGTLTQEVSKENNADPSEYQSQSLMRYNLILTQSLSVVVPCNLNLNAGDVIECLFPQVTDSVDAKEYDEEISGLYMIKELCHHFDTGRSYTSMKLIRDTFGTRV
jgi:hypothetical protein